MTVEPCVAIDVAQLTINFDRRYALCIQKLYHRLHLTVSRSWNKSLQLQQLQQCYCENSGSHTSAFIIRHHVHAVTSRNKWFNICETNWKLTLWMPLIYSITDWLLQSHLYIRCGNRRLSLAALPGLPATSRGVKLPLLADTHSVF